jgi:glycine dehydrogenase
MSNFHANGIIGSFLSRHLGPSVEDQSSMLSTLGYDSFHQFMNSVVPDNIRIKTEIDLQGFDKPMSEPEAIAHLSEISKNNLVFKNWIGQGYYNTFTPAVIQRNILENPSWYTSYTPYQPEISQGRLEAIINFQQVIIDLTGMDIANASMLDEGTSAAEAMTLAKRSCSSNSLNFFVEASSFPQTIDVIKTRAKPLGINIIVDDLSHIHQYQFFGAFIQYPGGTGALYSLEQYVSVSNFVHEQNALLVVAADLLALTIIESPSSFDADIVVGNSQRFGVPLGFGGPHAAYLATKDKFKRSMPGRLVGVSIDRFGNPAYRLALQTREQHIRREKATSNICTAQALLAIMAGMYATYHGPEGLKQIALRTHELVSILANSLLASGYVLVNEAWFDTLCIESPKCLEIFQAAQKQGINLRLIDSGHLGVSFDETTTLKDVEVLISIFGASPLSRSSDLEVHIPQSIQRSSSFLTHPTFNKFHSEHEMLRYMKKLSDKDLALDRTMIPLGSCTMKLNATSEMIPVSWPHFNAIHPFAPMDQCSGYYTMIEQLEKMLCGATGYDAISLQPNAGSQGEYAGLLIIKSYLESIGQGHRNICLIPSSAHGTNPASAQMVGLEVVVVLCDEFGNVDIADLTQKASYHSNNLAAIMITYPSTHGVFETGVKDICSIIHEHGGQVYIDGANMNALVGTAPPGLFGGDVSHLNLHKTFCIPHGGGGPGVGPVAVKSHLSPFLPSSFTGNTVNKTFPEVSRISSAPFGSASVLPISWMYIAMVGSIGLRRASEVAILNANYIAKKLSPHFPILYSALNGLVAHECILDIRPIQKISGISNEDIAKRLIDFGFHAPTMSFPVPGTLMIEPTESESKQELDRFIEAMVTIKMEIDQVISGVYDSLDNPLKNAPHTAFSLVQSEWTHPYSREVAAYPVSRLKDYKYWPPVGRVDNVYGDRNLFCSCIPLSEYVQD